MIFTIQYRLYIHRPGMSSICIVCEKDRPKICAGHNSPETRAINIVCNMQWYMLIESIAFTLLYGCFLKIILTRL